MTIGTVVFSCGGVVFKDATRQQYIPIGEAPRCPNPECENGRIKGTALGCAVCATPAHPEEP